MSVKNEWKKYRIDFLSFSVKSCKYLLKNNNIEITEKIIINTPVKQNLAVVDTKLRIYGNGAIFAEYNCVKSSRFIKFFPRFGIQFEIPKSFTTVKYFGLGPYVNLPDFKEHVSMGIYKTTVAEMHENYIKPQESATRCETHWAEITNNNGLGLRFEAIDKPFIFSANPYTSQECAKAMHRDDLTCNTTCINIDAEMLGAGSNACGPLPSKQYCLGPLKGKQFSLIIKPIG